MSSDENLPNDWRAGRWAPAKRTTAIFRGQSVRVVEDRVLYHDPVGAPTQATTKLQSRIELPSGEERVVARDELS